MTGEQRGVEVRVVPERVTVDFDVPLTATKGDETRQFSGFDVEVKSGMYELLMIATSIIDFESTYGDSETTLYLQYYPDLSIEKTKLSEGTSVYKLRNVVTGEEFVFASRSVAWPPGYGLETTRVSSAGNLNEPNLALLPFASLAYSSIQISMEVSG